jgi:hypothetical protein
LSQKSWLPASRIGNPFHRATPEAFSQSIQHLCTQHLRAQLPDNLLFKFLS